MRQRDSDLRVRPHDEPGAVEASRRSSAPDVRRPELRQRHPDDAPRGPIAPSPLETRRDGANGSGSEERVVLAYDCARGELSLDRTESGKTEFHEAFPSVERVAVPLENGRLRLQVFLDHCSIEVFAQDGTATITDLVFPANSRNAVGLLVEGDGATLAGLAVVG